MDRNRESADNWPTQQLWTSPGQGGHGGYVPPPAGPDAGGPPSPPPGGQGPRRSSRLTRWTVGITAAAVLVGGGAAALASTGHAAAPSGQAASLNTVLSSAESPSSADLAAASPAATSPATSGSATAGSAASSGHAKANAAVCVRAAKRLRAAHHPKAARRARAICRHGIARYRLLVRGIHGQFTFQTKKGARTLAFERGTIQSVSGSTVTVAASDGTTWTWHLVSNTVVRHDGKKAASSALANGQRVFVGGPVVSGADNARLIVIRPAKSATSPSTSPASSAPAS